MMLAFGGAWATLASLDQHTDNPFPEWLASHYEPLGFGSPTNDAWPERFVAALPHALALLAFLTLSVAGLAMVPTSPRPRRLVRLPGLGLCLVVFAGALTVLWPEVTRPARLWLHSIRSPGNSIDQVFLSTLGTCGPALVGGLLALAGLGRLRPGRSLRDRLAMLGAVLWLAVFVAWRVAQVASKAA
jgi:hypothetical protein